MELLPGAPFGKISLFLTLVPWASIPLRHTALWPRGNPGRTIVDLVALSAIPLAFLISFVGLFKDRPKIYAIAGVIISAAEGILVLVIASLAAALSL